jgi:hypothetical protein
MKKVNSLSYKAVFSFVISCIGIMILFASCAKTSDPVPVEIGDVHIKYVNAYLTSKPQNFYVNDTRLGTQSVGYGQSSDYFTTSSANTLFYFKTADSTLTSAGLQASLPLNGYYTFIYAQNSQGGKAIAALQDDMTAPAAGKARVRFFHLNNYIANTVPLTFSLQGGVKLAEGIQFGDITKYFEVDPNAKFSVTSTGLSTPLLIDGANIAAGKIYTIWIGGSSATILDSNTILSN